MFFSKSDCCKVSRGEKKNCFHWNLGSEIPNKKNWAKKRYVVPDLNTTPWTQVTTKTCILGWTKPLDLYQEMAMCLTHKSSIMSD